MGMATHIHTCPLCEATCGLRIETDNGDIKSIRGDTRMSSAAASSARRHTG